MQVRSRFHAIKLTFSSSLITPYLAVFTISPCNRRLLRDCDEAKANVKEEDEETFELSTRLFLFTVESWMLVSWCVLAALHFCRSIDISGDRVEISQCIFNFSARDNFWDAVLKTNYSYFLLFFWSSPLLWLPCLSPKNFFLFSCCAIWYP